MPALVRKRLRGLLWGHGRSLGVSRAGPPGVMLLRLRVRAPLA